VEEIESSYQYKLWTAMGILGAATRKNVWMGLAGKRLFLNGLIILVGPSGNRKTTALEVALPLIKDAECIQVIQDSATCPAMLERMSQIEYPDLNNQMKKQGHVLVYAEELTTFLTKSSLKEGQASQFMCKLLDCGDEAHHRTRGGGHLFIHDPYLHMITATTPAGIADTFTNLTWTGGLASRALFIYGNRFKKNPNPKELNPLIAENLIRDLRHIGSLSGEFTFSPRAQEYYTEWYMQLEEGDEDSPVAGLLNRGGTLARKFGCLISLAYKDNLIVNLKDLKEAIIAFEQIKSNLESIAKEDIKVQLADDLHRIYRLVKKHKTITRTRLMQRVAKYGVHKRRLDETLDYLVEMGTILVESQGTDYGPDGKVKRKGTKYKFHTTLPFLERAEVTTSYVKEMKEEIQRKRSMRVKHQTEEKQDEPERV
jgi:hypothetical protein